MADALMAVLQYAQQHVEDGNLESVLQSAYDELAVLLDPPKPTVVISLLPDGTAVGWDTCGSCKSHLKVCHCKTPKRPEYIEKMIARESGQSLQDLTTSVASTPKSQKGLSPKLGSPSTGKVDPENGTLVCINCKLPKSPDQGDSNDDGSFTCHVCQEGN